MKFSNMGIAYYIAIASCWSGEIPSSVQDEASLEDIGNEESMSKFIALTQTQLVPEEIIENVTKLQKCIDHSRSNLHEFLQSDLPCYFDMKTVTEFLETTHQKTVDMTSAPLTKGKTNLPVESFTKIIKRTDDMQVEINTVTCDIAKNILDIFNKICCSLLRYTELDIIDPFSLFFYPLKEFINHGNNNFKAFYSTLEENLDLLDHAIDDHREEIADVELCSTLRLVLKKAINNLRECFECRKRMEKYRMELHDFKYTLERKFKARKFDFERELTESEVLDVCYNRKVCKKILALDDALKHNQECLMSILSSLKQPIHIEGTEELHMIYQL